MKARPEGLDDETVVDALASGWGVEVAELVHAPVGFGSHHWQARDQDGRRWFVTVDELERHDAPCDEVFARIDTAFTVARDLHDAGLAFVVAPFPARDGAVVQRLDEDFSVALFPHVEGETGEFGDELTVADRRAVVDLLARLHAVPPPIGLTEPVLGLPGSRATLTALLADPTTAWTGGPYGEPARAWLQEHADAVRALVTRVERGAAAITARAPTRVLTHGEPHPGNVLATQTGLRLIDWDTVGLAPPERDLWHVESPAGDAAAHYEEVSGRAVDRDAIVLYREQWILDDLAITLHDLRAPHERDADTDALWRWLGDLQLED